MMAILSKDFGVGALLLAACTLLPTTPVLAQDEATTIERLRRDQDEILRKAERLQKLMLRLKTRYEREDKKEQVAYLDQGLAHLEQSGLLRDVASIREDLETTAFTEALRKQREVVDDLERLLNILLARKSIENIDEEMQKVEAQAKSARELQQRQEQLIEGVQRTLDSELTATEQELFDRFADLRDAEQREAERNSRQAGTRRPFLESALQAVKDLLGDQSKLETGLEDEAAGKTPSSQREAFDLGDLSQRVRELQRNLRDQQQHQQLGEAGDELQKAAAGQDPQQSQAARDRLQRLLDDPPKLPRSDGLRANDPKWTEVRKQVEQADDANTPAGQQQLQEIGKQASALADERNRSANEANGQEAGKLQQAAEQLQQRMQQNAPASADEQQNSAEAVAEASTKLAEAEQAIGDNDTEKARQRVNEALSALDKARSKHREENPDAARQAGKMAAEARATAQELANSPSPEQAEQQAGEALQQAAEALRDVAQQVQEARNDGQRPDAGQQSQSSRQSLEQARQTLEKALEQANQGNAADQNAAAERQQQLAEQTRQAQQQLQQAQQDGAVNQQQQQAAGEQLQQAMKDMQAAAESLQQGQQAKASQQQQQAAQRLQDAMEALQENRELSQQQQQQLADQAQAQEQLTEDIIRLAQELKERENENAERAAQEAAEASQKAQRAMEQGDTEETQKQQQKAREKLAEAAEELEQERDRYQDLRQEELLFRMQEELTTFLEKQRPITESIKGYQQADTRRMSRPVRRKVNALGEDEQALAGRIEFLVSALTQEGNVVYRSVLQSLFEDLREISRRLAGRRPDIGSFTTLMQDDVERRAEQLLAALEREQKRREEERQQQQQQQQGENKFNPGQERLVKLIAELEMLKELGSDTERAADNLRTLVEVRGSDTITESEVAMIERLHHRHNEITKLFEQIKASVEQALQQQAEQGEEGGESGR